MRRMHGGGLGDVDHRNGQGTGGRAVAGRRSLRTGDGCDAVATCLGVQCRGRGANGSCETQERPGVEVAERTASNRVKR